MAPKEKKKAGEVSASVEESNALRASLGLRPLDTADAKSTTGSSRDPVHVPADVASQKVETAADKRKAAATAKTKKDHEALISGKGLGDILAEEEGKSSSASDWVSKTRDKSGAMKATGAIAADRDAKRKAAAGGAAEAPRIKVRHDAKDLPEGTDVVMTLSDSTILDKDGNINSGADELSNTRMNDLERAKHNEAVKSQVEYDPSKGPQNILDKYDELKTGPAGFLLGGSSGGTVLDEGDPEKRLAFLTKMSDQQTLEMKTKVQSDFYTTEEMMKFKKAPKKKTKKRKMVEAKDKEDQIGDPSQVPDPDRPPEAGSDEEDPELYEQLSKQRRLVRRSDAGAMKKGEAALAAVSERIQKVGDGDDKDKEDKDKANLGIKPGKEGEAVAMTATTEFCNVVQTPLEKMDTMKHESFRGSTLYKQQVAQRKGIAAGESRRRRLGLSAHELGEDLGNIKDDEEPENLHEDGLDLTCASGLAYLRARSQIGMDQESHKNRKSDNRPLEMSTVDGDIKLEYRDDYGRVQTPKEAFRAISWKFHGKVPGRKNMERRLLRLENEMRLKSMDPMSSLPTLRALRHVQSADSKPYMVLSGANEK